MKIGEANEPRYLNATPDRRSYAFQGDLHLIYPPTDRLTPCQLHVPPSATTQATSQTPDRSLAGPGRQSRLLRARSGESGLGRHQRVLATSSCVMSNLRRLANTPPHGLPINLDSLHSRSPGDAARGTGPDPYFTSGASSRQQIVTCRCQGRRSPRQSRNEVRSTTAGRRGQHFALRAARILGQYRRTTSRTFAPVYTSAGQPDDLAAYFSYDPRRRGLPPNRLIRLPQTRPFAQISFGIGLQAPAARSGRTPIPII